MAKVKFNYNTKKDAWSWVVIAKLKNMWGLNLRSQLAHIPDEIMAKIIKASYPKAIEITEAYIKKDRKKTYKQRIIKGDIRSLEKAWEPVESKFFKILSNITQKPIFRDRFDCFWTTGFMCPYNEKENWFMVSMWHSIPFSITTICHEIMHLQFLHYYRKYLKKKGLRDNQIENFKEALTFLLNEPEFAEIILSQDSSYPEHQKMREKLRKIWLKEKDFQKFLDRAIREIYSIK